MDFPVITALRFASSTLPESWMFPQGDSTICHPISFCFFCVQEGDRRILVDTGCDTMPGFVMENFIPPVKVLAQQGISPNMITDVIITHAHHDHMEALRYFPHCRLHIHTQAYQTKEALLSQHGEISLFDDEATITPHIRIRHIGGHAAGSSIVLVDGERTTYVLCGDECYSMENLRRHIPTASSVCPERSQFFVDTYSNGEYAPLLCHDPTIQTGIIK